MTAVQVQWCSPCASEQLFEQPPCADGHDTDCWDLACVECGHAIMIGLQFAETAPMPVARAA